MSDVPMCHDDKVITALVAAEEAAIRCITADRYARPEDPNADAAHEHAVESFALACRDVVDAVDAGDPREWPIGWACGEVGTGWPNGTDGGPVNTQPCRFRPGHEGPHDWVIAEDVAELEKSLVEVLALLERLDQSGQDFDTDLIRGAVPAELRRRLAARVNAVNDELVPAR